MSTNLFQGKANSCESSNARSITRENLGTQLSLQQPDAYICSRCSKGFPSSQALGGHQNAHKRERNGRERKQMLEEQGRMKLEERTRMMMEEHLLMKEMNHNTPGILSPHPLQAVASNGEDMMPILMQIPMPNQGNGLITNPEAMLAFHSRNGQARFIPGSGFDLSLGDKGTYHHISHRVVNHENFNNGYEIPYGVPLANENNRHPDYPTINKKLRPWEPDMNPVTNFDHSVAWMRESSNAVVEDASIGAFLKRQETNEATFNEELDLTLRL